ncbi:MAG: signal peptidase I [Dehalococcoidales bacterium]
MKIFTWIISIILALTVTGLAFIYFSPNHNMYMVKSESMVPALNLGDVIVTGPVGGFLSGGVGPGSIVTYRHGSELVTHRVVSVEDGAYTIKGDAVKDSETIVGSQIVGAYIFKIPKLGYLVNFMRTKLGWYLVVIVPAIIFVGLIFREIVKEVMHKTTA